MCVTNKKKAFLIVCKLIIQFCNKDEKYAISTNFAALVNLFTEEISWIVAYCFVKYLKCAATINTDEIETVQWIVKMLRLTFETQMSYQNNFCKLQMKLFSSRALFFV